MNNILKELDKKAKKLGATEFGISKAKNKRFYVVYDKKIINFASKIGQTFIDHHDENKRNSWKARHSRILKEGKPAYKNKHSPSYWSWSILW
jgi:hypothetical protein